MSFFQVVLLGVGLAMDAFAVAVCKGACWTKMNVRQSLLLAVSFGVFQAVMPLIGWVLGTQFQAYIESFDHWVAFFLLAYLGVKMILEVIEKNDAPEVCKILTVKEVLLLSVATSIDALAVGIVLAIEKSPILMPIAVIGAVTFVISLLGAVAGNRFGARFKDKAQIVGGAVLMLIGLKILFEHLNII